MREIKNKSQQIAESILARISLLEHILATPKEFVNDEVIRKALKSQGGLSNLNYTFGTNDLFFKIYPISITTLKAKVSTVSEGLTWETFDALRVQALDVIEYAARKANDSPKQTKLGMKEALETLETELENQREINFRLIHALTRAVGEIESIQSTTKADLRAKRARDAIEIINKILGLNDYPFNNIEHKTTIVRLRPDIKP